MQFNLGLVFISIAILFTIACNSDDQRLLKSLIHQINTKSKVNLYLILKLMGVWF